MMKPDKFDPVECIGERYGKLTIVEHVETKRVVPSTGGRPYLRHYVKVHCDCGDHADFVARYNELRSGAVDCCRYCSANKRENSLKGLVISKHDPRYPILVRKYNNMVVRCTNPNHPDWFYYGGNDPPVYIAPEWYTPGVIGNPGKVAYINWHIEHGWEPGLETDRWPDRRGPYAPWNCRIADRQMQTSNTSANIYVEELDGEQITLAEMDRRYFPDKARHYSTSMMHAHNWSANALRYKGLHPELNIHRSSATSEYVDDDGFRRLIPTVETERKLNEIHKDRMNKTV